MLEGSILNSKLFNNPQPLNAIDVEGLVPLCAEVSMRIYNGFFILPGWDLFSTYEDAGTHYRGAMYTRNLLTTNAQILLVHRGTTMRPDNLFGDFQIALGHLPLQAESVSKFLIDAVRKLTKIYKPDEDHNHLDMMRYLQTITTGHSLGAILSDYVGLNAHASITFENPGSRPILQAELIKMRYPLSMISSLLNRMKNVCQVYQAGVNIINTCNEQVGRTFRISIVDYEYKLNTAGLLLFPPPPNYGANFTYTVDYSLDQHSMTKLEKYIREGEATIEVSNPVGFQVGYVEYLNPIHKDYWNGYLNKIWTSDSVLAAGIRLKYNNDQNAFNTVSYQELTSLYQQLTKSSLYIQPNEKLLDTAPEPMNDIVEIVDESILVDKPSSAVPTCN